MPDWWKIAKDFIYGTKICVMCSASISYNDPTCAIDGSSPCCLTCWDKHDKCRVCNKRIDPETSSGSNRYCYNCWNNLDKTKSGGQGLGTLILPMAGTLPTNTGLAGPSLPSLNVSSAEDPGFFVTSKDGIKWTHQISGPVGGDLSATHSNPERIYHCHSCNKKVPFILNDSGVWTCKTCLQHKDEKTTPVPIEDVVVQRKFDLDD